MIAHNARFDLKFLAHHLGFTFGGGIHDTRLLAQLTNENRPLGLKDLSASLLGADSLSEKRELDRLCSLAGAKHVGELCRADLEAADAAAAKGLPAVGPYFETIARYCKEDCNNTFRLFYVLSKRLAEVNENVKKIFQVPKGPLDYYKEEAAPTEKVLLKLELRGLLVNREAVAELRAKLLAEQAEGLERITEFAREEIRQVEEQLYELARSKRASEKGKAKVERSSEKYLTKFNWASGDHLAKLLYGVVGVPKNLVKKTKSGRYSTNDNDLAMIRQVSKGTRLGEILDKLQEVKRLAKLLSTYVGKDSEYANPDDSGRIYPLYLQAGRDKEAGGGGTVTGRLSSQSPNVQNLPRGPGVKRFFIPQPGNVFLYADYSQLELRLAAHLSGDPELVSAYAEGRDLHKQTAAAIFGKNQADVTPDERQAAKTINFAMIYDASAYRLYMEPDLTKYGIDGIERMRREFFAQYSVYKDYLRSELVKLRLNKALVSAAGRVRRLPEIAYGEGLDWRRKGWNGSPGLLAALAQPGEVLDAPEVFQRAKKKYSHASKQGYNFPIQSLGASICKRAMVALDAAGFKLVNQVHDSVVCEVSSDQVFDKAKQMRYIMEKAAKLKVPLVAEVKMLQSFDEKDVFLPVPATAKVA